MPEPIPECLKGGEPMTDLEQAIANMVQQAVDKLTDPERLYNAKDLAERYDCSPATAAAWIRAGLFGETVNPSKNKRLVTMAGIRKYDAEHTGPAYNGEKTSIQRSRRKKTVNPGKI